MSKQSSSRFPAFEVAQFAMPNWPVMSATGWQPIVEAMTSWNAKVWTAAAQANGEYFDFLRKRGNADLKFAQALSHCRTSTEAWPVVMDFWMSAANDYSAELQNLANQWAAMTSEGASAIASASKTIAIAQKTRLAA